MPENSVQKTDENVTDGNNSTINEDVIMVDDDDDDAISTSSNAELSMNDTSIVSTSDNGLLENATPSKKLNTKVKKQESAKKQEERLRLKQVR